RTIGGANTPCGDVHALTNRRIAAAVAAAESGAADEPPRVGDARVARVLAQRRRTCGEVDLRADRVGRMGQVDDSFLRVPDVERVVRTLRQHSDAKLDVAIELQ